MACDFVRLTDYPAPSRKLRVPCSRGQQLLRLDFEGAFHDVDASLLMGKGGAGAAASGGRDDPSPTTAGRPQRSCPA